MNLPPKIFDEFSLGKSLYRDHSYLQYNTNYTINICHFSFDYYTLFFYIIILYN